MLLRLFKYLVISNNARTLLVFQTLQVNLTFSIGYVTNLNHIMKQVVSAILYAQIIMRPLQQVHSLFQNFIRRQNIFFLLRETPRKLCKSKIRVVTISYPFYFSSLMNGCQFNQYFILYLKILMKFTCIVGQNMFNFHL